VSIYPEFDAGIHTLTEAEAATLRGLREKKLVAVPREPSEAMLDAMAEAHADAFAGARRDGKAGLAPCEWLPAVYAAMLAAAEKQT
jgi:hypothetical protein